MEEQDLPEWMMGDILQYFEEKNQALDNAVPSLRTSLVVDPEFLSCIRFNGVPILPPVLTTRRREEMCSYKQQAIDRMREKKHKNRSNNREQFTSRVRNIIADMEEERSESWSKSSGLQISSQPISSSSSDHLHDPSTDVPSSSESDISPSGLPPQHSNKQNYKSKRKQQYADKTTSNESVDKRSPSAGNASFTPSDKPQRLGRRRTTSEGDKTHHQPVIDKARSRSPSPSARPSSPIPRVMENLRRSSSLSSLPNMAKIEAFKVPRPPDSGMTTLQKARQTSLRQISNSQPDLRDIGMEEDDTAADVSLLKTMSNPDLSLSQFMANDCQLTPPSAEKAKPAWYSRNQTPEPVFTQITTLQKDGKNPKTSAAVKKIDLSMPMTKTDNSVSLSTKSSSPRPVSPKPPTPNSVSPKSHTTRSVSPKPPTGLSAQHKKQIEKGNSLRNQNSNLHLTPERDGTLRKKLTETQHEAKDEEPEISKKSLKSFQGDLLPSDFPSLDDPSSGSQGTDSGPLNYGSAREQEISRTLAKLSKVLNLGDTLSTLSTLGSEKGSLDPEKEKMLLERANRPDQGSPVSKVRQGAGMDQGQMITESKEGRKSLPQQPSATKNTDSPATSAQNSGNPRLSPKPYSVHFAPMVTEISSSANDSLESQISIKKLNVNITPQSSVNLEETGRTVSGFPQEPDSLLSRVAFSTDIESPVTSPHEEDGNLPNVPFSSYTASCHDNEVSSSDKENDCALLQRVSLKASTISDDGSQGSTLRGSNDTAVKVQMASGHDQSNDRIKQQNGTGKNNSLQREKPVSPKPGLRSQHPILVHPVAHRSRSYRPDSGGQSWEEKNQSNPQAASVKREQNQQQQRPQQYPQNQQPPNVHVQQSVPKNNQNASNKHKQNSIGSVGPKQNGQAVNTIPNEVKATGLNSQHKNPVFNGEVISREQETKDSEEHQAKQDHIQRYLSQVQQHSLEAEDIEDEEFIESQKKPVSAGNSLDLKNTIDSFMSSLQSLNHLDEEQLLQIQAHHFDQLRQHLIEQQKSQLEDLFIQQRREQLTLQQEIQTYQQQIKDHNDFLVETSVDSVDYSKVVDQPSVRQHSQIQSNQAPNNARRLLNMEGSHVVDTKSGGAMIPPLAIGSQANIPPSNGNRSSGQVQGHMQGQAKPPRRQLPAQPNVNKMSPVQAQQKRSPPEITEQFKQPEPGSSGNTPPNDLDNSKRYSYISSPSLYFNPRIGENGSDISTFSKTTPKHSLQFNHSTPTPPLKKQGRQTVTTREKGNHISSQAMLQPERLQHCFERVSACVKGYLTRRLMRTEKVQEIIKTIMDTKDFALKFQRETPIKRGAFTNQDKILLDRIIAQLQSALWEIHEIFFLIPVHERMSIIDHSRRLMQERTLRESESTRASGSTAHPRVSSATLKAQERRKKASETKDANLAVSRPKSAPPIQRAEYNNSPDIAPNNMDQRALRPLTPHGQQTQNSSKLKPRTNSDAGSSFVKPKKPTYTSKVTGVNKSQGSSTSNNRTATTNKTNTKKSATAASTQHTKATVGVRHVAKPSGNTTKSSGSQNVKTGMKVKPKNVISKS